MSGTQQPVANGVERSRAIFPTTNAWARPLLHATVVTNASGTVRPATMTTMATPRGSKKLIVGKEEVMSSGGEVLRERFLHLISSLIGQRVVVTKTNGTQLEGILHTFTPFGESSSLSPEQRNLYVLRAAKILFTETTNNSTSDDQFPEGSTVLVPACKVQTLQIKAFPLLLTPTTSNVNNKEDSDSAQQPQLPTDADISSSLSTLKKQNNKSANSTDKALVAAGSVWTAATMQRETTATPVNSTKRIVAPTSASISAALPWRQQRTSTAPSSTLGGYASAVKATANTSTGTKLATSEGVSSLSGNIGGWDQFQANERLFNVKATFDENQYTIALDKSAIPSHVQYMAERMAREIEAQTSDNIHIMEERGKSNTLENDLDEEDKYSGVLRGNTTASPQDKPAPQSQPDEEPALKNDDEIASPAETFKESSQDIGVTNGELDEKGSSDDSVIDTMGDNVNNITLASSEELMPKVQPASSKLNPSAKEFTFNPAARSFTMPSVSSSSETPTIATLPYYELPTDASGVPPQQSFLPHHHYPHPQQLVPAGFYPNYRPQPPPGATGPYNPMGGQQMPQMVPAGNPYGVYRGPMQPGMIPGPTHPQPPLYPGNYQGHNVMYGSTGGAMQQQQQTQGSSGRGMEGDDGGYRGGRGLGRGMVRGGGGRRNNARNINSNKGRMMLGRGPYYPTMSYSSYNAGVASGGQPQHGDMSSAGVVMNYYDGSNTADPSFSDHQQMAQFIPQQEHDSTVAGAEEIEVPKEQADEP